MRLTKRIRIVATVAGLAGVLVLTGCGGDGGGGGAQDRDAAAGGASASAEPSKSSGPDDDGSLSDGLEGNWLATTDGEAVALVITGKDVGLFQTDGSVCGGTAGGADGKRTIQLSCAGKADDRGHGTVESVDAETLKVSWQGFGDETFRRTEGDGLPDSLPTPAPGQ